MAYKALYRTYRPSTFDEVAGQQHVVKTLKNALASKKIAHAYLFAGPRGTGKTSMAKLFAKALNCEEGVGCQCNKCKNCLEIISGSHPDVLELDAASNNGVDEIRELIDKVKYGTILGRYKIYIIDEVHMLTKEAFNALLKTLEEPPEHVIFILATTEPHKIIPTILSRCQRYDFTKVSNEDIKERLKIILKQENVTYVEEAVNLIINLCDGGMRDALSILDKVLAYSGNTLSVQDILDIYALESKEEKISLLNAVSNSDIPTVLNKLNNYINKGTDIVRLTNDLLTILKDVLIFATSRNEEYLEVLNRDEARMLLDSMSNEYILNAIGQLLDATKDYKTVNNVNSLFEITLLKLCSLDNNYNEPRPIREKPLIKQPIPTLEAKREEVKKEVVTEVQKEEPVVVPQEPIIVNESIKIDSNKFTYLEGSLSEDKFQIDDDTIINIMVTSKKAIKDELLNKWSNIKKYVINPDLGKYANLLVDTRPLVASNDMILVECQFPNVAEKINSKENQAGLQALLNKAVDKPAFIYALPRTESVRLQGTFMNKYQVGKLPKLADINLKFIGGK